MSTFHVYSDHAIRSFVFTCYGVDETKAGSRFPGAMPSTLMRSDLPKLCGKTSPYIQYVVSLKVDGERALLAVLPDGATFAIDRAMKSTELTGLQLPPSTLLDVERSGDGIVWVFDAVMIGGRSLRSMPYHHRLSLANDVIQGTPLLRVKPIEVYRIPAAVGVGAVDGLVFTPVTQAIKPFRNTDMFKWKPLEHHTVDLRWLADCTLVALDGGHDVVINKCSMPGDRQIWECRFDGGEGIWMPVKPRKDRADPNALYVVRAVEQCIRENITLDELHALFDT